MSLINIRLKMLMLKLRSRFTDNSSLIPTCHYNLLSHNRTFLCNNSNHNKTKIWWICMIHLVGTTIHRKHLQTTIFKMWEARLQWTVYFFNLPWWSPCFRSLILREVLAIEDSLRTTTRMTLTIGILITFCYLSRLMI